MRSNSTLRKHFSAIVVNQGVALDIADASLMERSALPKLVDAGIVETLIWLKHKKQREAEFGRNKAYRVQLALAGRTSVEVGTAGAGREGGSAGENASVWDARTGGREWSRGGPRG